MGLADGEHSIVAGFDLTWIPGRDDHDAGHRWKRSLQGAFDRRFAAAQPQNSSHAERLILDGQQRLTSLFQALLLQRPIDTQDIRKRRISGWFYVDMAIALDENLDREEAFRFIPADKTVRSFRGELELDLSTVELEYAAELFPVNRLLDPEDWLDGYVEHWNYDKSYQKRRTSFRNAVQESPLLLLE